MMTYYVYRGCTACKWHHWLLTAVCAAGACLSKYTAGVVGLSLCLFVLVNKDARKIFLSIKPYAALLLFAGLMTPHIMHLIKTDFVVFEYINYGIKPQKYGYFMQLLVQCAAIAAPLVCMETALLVSRIFDRRRFSFAKPGVTNAAALQYSGCIIGGQIAFLLITGLCGHRLLTIWTFPLYLTAGIFLMSFYPQYLDDRVKRAFAVLCSAVAALLLIFPLIYYNCSSKYRYHMRKADMRETAEKFYREQTGREIPFITGDIWSAAMLQNTFKYSVKAAPAFDVILMGLHRDTVCEKGALVASLFPEADAEYVRKMFGVELKWQKAEIAYRARFGKTKTFAFSLAVIPPGAQWKLEDRK